MLNRNRLLFVAATALACAFAPVPPPRTGVAEAVFSPTGRGTESVRRSLLAALPRALQSEKAQGLNCLKGEANPAEWVGKHLRAEEVTPGGPVRVRLAGCRPSEALSLLTALVAAYESGRRSRGLEEELVAGQLRQRMVVARGGNGGVIVTERTVTRRRGAAVLQRPRLIDSGKSR
jgi:hypothetical protein